MKFQSLGSGNIKKSFVFDLHHGLKVFNGPIYWYAMVSLLFLGFADPFMQDYYIQPALLCSLNILDRSLNFSECLLSYYFVCL